MMFLLTLIGWPMVAASLTYCMIRIWQPRPQTRADVLYALTLTLLALGWLAFPVVAWLARSWLPVLAAVTLCAFFALLAQAAQSEESRYDIDA